MPSSGWQKFIPYLALSVLLVLVGLNSLKGERGAAVPAGALEQGGELAGKGGKGGDGAATGLSMTSGRRKLVVDVAGAVRQPGVYHLVSGSRVIDAIRRAGGLSQKALPGAINRAASLADGQQVVVPLRAGSDSNVAATTPAAAGSKAPPVSLGSATAEQLEQIDGIGPVTAGNIIEYRDSKGGLSSVDELDQVSGIGPVTMETLRSSLQP